MREAILSLNARGRAKGHILAFLTVFVWGITFVSTKVLLTVVTPIEILFLRFSLGFLALCVIHHRITPFMGARVEALFALAGATGVTLYFFMENIALTMTSASNVGVIVAIAPLFIALIATFVTREERVGAKFFAGFVMAISGITLISFTGAAAGDAGLAGCLLAVLAALACIFLAAFLYETALSYREVGPLDGGYDEAHVCVGPCVHDAVFAGDGLWPGGRGRGPCGASRPRHAG